MGASIVQFCMWGAYGVVVVVVCRNVVCFQILSYFILEDFIFYWGHRILHTKWLYKHVHSVHHECVISTLNLHTYMQHIYAFLERIVVALSVDLIWYSYIRLFLSCLFAADMPPLLDWLRSTPILRRFCFWVLLPYLDLPSLALIFWHSGCGWACESLRQLKLIAVMIFPGAFPDTCQSTEGKFWNYLDILSFQSVPVILELFLHRFISKFSSMLSSCFKLWRY